MSKDLEPRPLRVGLCQMTSTDLPSENLRQIQNHIKRGLEKNAKTFFFPENSLYLRIEKGPLECAFSFESSEIRELEQMSRVGSVSLVLGSVPWKLPTGVGNCTLWISPEQGVQVVYQKIHLFDVDVEGHVAIRESSEFVSGQGPSTLDSSGWRFGFSICYDLRFSELYNQYAQQNVQVLLIPSAFLCPTGSAHWHILNRARAIENQCYVIAAAQGGEHRGARGGVRQTYGHSLVVGPWGEIIAESRDSNETPVVELSMNEITRVRQQIPMAKHRHQSLLAGLWKGVEAPK